MLGRREIETYRREKELAERELELARREIALLRREAVASRGGRSGRDGGVAMEQTALPRVQSWRPDLADLLSDFDGISGSFDTWEKQLRFLKATYHLDGDQAKILMGSKLKKRAFEWFHSRPEYMTMPFEDLVEEFRAMFQRRESKAALRKRFESRMWRRDETFHEYVHEKIIMGNRVPVDQDEMLEHTIDGIPDVALRDQARIQGFVTMDSLLRAFEKVSLRDRGEAASGRRGERAGRSAGGGKPERSGGGGGASGSDDRGVEKGKMISNKRCFNCGAREHVGANCPKKELGVKCFGCGEHGHIASRCLKKNNNESREPTVSAISCMSRKKYSRQVTVNGRVFTALIDTGSDVSIMRASEYAAIGSPDLQASKVEFCGIGGYSVASLGRFKAEILIDGHHYPIFIYIVANAVVQCSLIVGTDFLDTVEVNIKQGVILIKPILKKMINDETQPEIFAIDAVR